MSCQVFACDIGTTAPYEVVHVSEVSHRFLCFFVSSSSISSLSCRRMRLKGMKVNVPVRLQSDEQDAVIKPGDYLLGDLNGVVCLPKELAEKAIPLMALQVEADEKVAFELDRGMRFVEASKKHRGGIRKA